MAVLQYAGVDTMNATGPAPTAASRETSWNGQAGIARADRLRVERRRDRGRDGRGQRLADLRRVDVLGSFTARRLSRGWPATSVVTRCTPVAGKVVTSG